MHTHKKHIQTQVFEQGDISLQIAKASICQWVAGFLVVKAIYYPLDDELTRRC